MADTKPHASIQVHVTGNRDTRISAKSGKPYTQAEGYAILPGIPYPQRFKFYCETEAQVPAPGIYECYLEISIKNDNLDFRCDPRQGRRVGDVPKQTAA
jgi:hypothetical protein